MVENDPERVEADLAAGRLVCPLCGGALARWGFARRRRVRAESGGVEVHPRRCRCRGCGRTQVLLPDLLFLRRVDTTGVIGRAVRAAAQGAGHRVAAAVVGRPASTVRGWLRRLRARAILVAAHFSAWAYRLDPNLAPIVPAGTALSDALEAIGVAARAASLRLGPRPGWSWASVLSAGLLISNTSSPWPVP